MSLAVILAVSLFGLVVALVMLRRGSGPVRLPAKVTVPVYAPGPRGRGRALIRARSR